MATAAATKAKAMMKEVNSVFGKSVVRMASDPYYTVRYIPTGVLPVDILVGGLARNRFTYIVGDWSTLKSWIGLKAIASCQQLGGVAVLIDTEHAFDPSWATETGVDVDSLIIWPDPEDDAVHTGEEAIDMAQQFTARKVDLIVFDSIAATLTQDEANKRLSGENQNVATLARLMSSACKRLTTTNSNTAFFWINQLRENIGITFGSRDAEPGGKSMGYYAGLKLQVRKVGKVTENVQRWNGEKYEPAKRTIGQRFKLTVEKSKLSKPHEEAFFVWDYKTGALDEVGYLIGLALEKGIITVKGNTWQYGEHKAVGRAKFRTMVESDPSLQASVKASVFPGLESPPRKRTVARKKRRN